MQFDAYQFNTKPASVKSIRAYCGHAVLHALACTLAWLLPIEIGFAAPTLSLTNIGSNLSGNTEWLVEVTPDAALFQTTDLGLGSSLAVEIGIEVSGSDLVGAVVNDADWPIDVNGNNPFTAGLSSGLSLDLASNTLFVSLLSNFFLADNPIEVLTLETSGINCPEISLGGHDILSGMPGEYVGSLIAQAGQNFTGYQETISPPLGDFNADCDVNGVDFLTWQRNYNAPYTASDLTDWESNYGAAAPLLANTIPVPEPTTLLHLLLGFQTLCLLGHSSRMPLNKQR